METELFGDGRRAKRVGACSSLGAVSSLALLPQRIHLLERRLLGRAALLLEPAFDIAEAPLEFGVRIAQRGFGIDPQVSAHVYETEQQIADLVRDSLEIGRRGELGSQLLDFLHDFVERTVRIRPLEADLGGALAELVRARQRRQRERHVVENALRRLRALATLL